MSGAKGLAGAKWFEQRVAEWRSAGRRLQGIERGASAPPETVLEAVRAYPEIARDLAIARRAAPNGPLTKYLEGVYLQLHRSLFRPPTAFWRGVLRLFTHEAAAAARELRWHIASVAALLVVCVGAGAWLVGTYPELATLFALCLGVLYGLGTFYIIAMNGLSIGGIFAFTAQYGAAERLFAFTAAHGFVELSVVCISGAVGASLGESLARPGELTRGAAFQSAVMRGMRLMAVCLVFLVGAGVLEGFVSPDPRFPLAARLAIGLTYFTLFVLVLFGALGRFGRRARRA